MTTRIMAGIGLLLVLIIVSGIVIIGILGILGIVTDGATSVLSSLAFIFGTGWDKKARESIRKIDLLASSLHARLPMCCRQTINTPLYKGSPICFAAVAYGAVLYAFFLKKKSWVVEAKLKAYRKLIRDIGSVESNVIDEIEHTMRIHPLVFWDYSEWIVRKLCAGDVPSDISKACAMVHESIVTASRLVVLQW